MPAYAPVSTQEILKLRDLGPYSSRNASKGAMLDELYKIITHVSDASSKEEIKRYIFEENGLNKKTYENRRMVWDRLNHRYFSIAAEWIVGSLISAAKMGPESTDFKSLAYLYYVLRDHAVHDFVTQTIWERWKHRSVRLTYHDYLEFLVTNERKLPEKKPWREVTKKRLASSVLAALRDFGLLEGKATKKIQPPAVGDEAAFHLLSVLWFEGKRGKGIIDSPDWRIFLWDESDTATALNRLAQRKWINFERSGSTVILNLNRMPEG